MSRHIFHQTRLLRAPSKLALNPAREGAATASLGNLDQCLTTLISMRRMVTPSHFLHAGEKSVAALAQAPAEVWKLVETFWSQMVSCRSKIYADEKQMRCCWCASRKPGWRVRTELAAA